MTQTQIKPTRQVAVHPDHGAGVACSQMGIPIHQCDMTLAVQRIQSFVRTGRQTGRSHQVVTVNADFLVTAHHHDDVHAILREADLALADGMPIVWASTVLGVKLPERVAGADLVPTLAAAAADHGHRMMLFGGLAGSGEATARILRNDNPGLEIASIECKVGQRGETAAEYLEQIRRFDPDILCVALGHPKQERWIRTHAAALGVPVSIGIGGTLDFISEQRKRAPKWIGAIGFEWLYRLAQEPQRLSKRYLDDFAVFIPSIVRQMTHMAFADQFRRTEARVERHSQDSDGLSLSNGRVGRQTVEQLSLAVHQIRSAGLTPTMELPSYRQTRALKRERLDRMFTFVPKLDERAPETPKYALIGAGID